MTTPNKTVPVSTGAEAFLAQMRALGSVRYMFANTGTDHGPLIEAMARTAGEDPREIRPIVVPHEQAAVSMAHGYYNVTQQPQMVLVHTLPGTANALGGVINAASANVPLFLCAGRTPITEGELRGGKSQNIHWRQESRDQGASCASSSSGITKFAPIKISPRWSSRAYKIAMSEPRGPVYMTLPREWLAEAMESTQVFAPDALAPASKTQADQASLEKTADWLIASDSPLIVTKYLGRNPEAVQSLIELSELLAIPVVQQMTYVNFPTDHPLHLRHPGDEICAQRGCVVFHRHRRAVGAAQPQRVARRREDRSPRARSAVHRHSRLGVSRRFAGERLFGSVAAGAERDHPQQA